MNFSALLLFGLCLLASFLYAGIEAGLLSLSRARLRSRIHQKERAAIRLGRLLEHPGRLLATVLLVTNFADVAALVLSTDACVRFLGVRGYAVAGLVMLPVYLVALQMLPKSLFRRFPYRATAYLTGLLEATSRLLWPVLTVGRALLGRPLLPSASALDKGLAGTLAARQDFKSLAAEGERTGALSPAEHRMIGSVLDFYNVATRELVEPLPVPFVLPEEKREGLQVHDLLAFVQEKGAADYLPIVGEDGVLLALTDVFALRLERDSQRLAAAYLRRAPLIVAPDESALQTLRRLRSLRLGAAVVRGEKGQLLGLVRTRELLGRLVQGQVN